MDYKEKVIALLNSQELSKEQKEKLENIFPELKESSDEKIRKELITHCRNTRCVTEEGYEWDSEKKELKKIEPKFKVGDWVTNGVSTYQVYDIRDNEYWLSAGEIAGKVDISDYHLWTIQDAKDGDVLAIDWIEENSSNIWEKIVIFKSLSKDGVEGYGNTFRNKEKAFDDSVPYYSKTWTKNLHPATKEQRDLLFQKMKEAGYEWDSEKKELSFDTRIRFNK